MMTARSTPAPLLLATLALTLGLSGGCQEQATVAGGGFVLQKPLVPDRPTFHDFGMVEVGDKMHHTFELLNTDPSPINIRQISPACVCTLGRVWVIDAEGNRTNGSLVDKPIISVPSGATAHVRIDLDTTHVPTKNTDKLALVRLTCDSPNTPVVTFELHTFVRAPLQVTPKELDLKVIPVSSGGRGTVDAVTGVRDSSVRVLGVGETSPGLEVEIEEHKNFNETVWTASVYLPPGRPLGGYRGWFELRVTDYEGEGEGRPMRIPVIAIISPDLRLSPSPLAFSRFTPEKGAWSRTLLRTLIPGDRVKIENASLTGEHADELSVNFASTDADTNGRSTVWTITLLAPPELEGESFNGTLRLELDHPEYPELQAKYTCRPR